MPKKYPVEVRLFAVQKKQEGHSWDRVAEMVKQNFGLDPPPSCRQMIEWKKTSGALPGKQLSYEEFLDIAWSEPLGPIPGNKDAPLYRHLFGMLVKAGVIEAIGEIPKPFPTQVPPLEARVAALERRINDLESKLRGKGKQKDD